MRVQGAWCGHAGSGGMTMRVHGAWCGHARSGGMTMRVQGAWCGLAGSGGMTMRVHGGMVRPCRVGWHDHAGSRGMVRPCRVGWHDHAGPRLLIERGFSPQNAQECRCAGWNGRKMRLETADWPTRRIARVGLGESPHLEPADRPPRRIARAEPGPPIEVKWLGPCGVIEQHIAIALPESLCAPGKQPPERLPHRHHAPPQVAQSTPRA